MDFFERHADNLAGAWLVAVGAVLLVGASIWNVAVRRRCEAGSRTHDAAEAALECRP